MAGTPTGRRRPRKRIEIGRNLRPPRRLGRRIRLFGTTHNPRKIRFHAFCSTKLHTHTDQMSTSCSRLTKKRNVPTNLLEREETGERLKCSINTSLHFVKFGLEFYFLQLWNGSKCSSSKGIQKKNGFSFKLFHSGEQFARTFLPGVQRDMRSMFQKRQTHRYFALRRDGHG